MPTTLAGFLLFAGTIMLVISFLQGTVKVKGVELTAPGPRDRLALRMTGLLFLCLAATLYVAAIIGGRGAPSPPRETMTNESTDLRPRDGDQSGTFDQGGSLIEKIGEVGQRKMEFKSVPRNAGGITTEGHVSDQPDGETRRP